ncbi:unnamed protein product [Ceutorhynchus assimilis]|uniref:Uncharacterized protein n=1 Tax=Ceutorhynchus assimilis TaxID=467358 RepID=A0A9N9M9N4_9CUCU|nr:unnamed protein product [Ceutorhynchus assimilis]
MYKLLTEQNNAQTQKLTKQIQESESNVTRKFNSFNRKIEKIHEKNVSFERKIRRNNILLFGFNSENCNSLIKDTLAKLNELFGTNIRESDINNLYKLGRKGDSPILIEFLSYLKKSELFKDAEKLRALKNTGYAISNDLCNEDREELKIIKKHFKKARDEEKQVKIKGLTLELEGKIYTAKQLEQSDTDTDSGGSNNYSEPSSLEEEEEEVIEEEYRNKTNKTEECRPEKAKKKRKKSKTPSPIGAHTRSNKKRR